MKQKVSSLVDGGTASPGPPLGPTLGPLGVNISAVVNAINEKTKSFAGMKVPVVILIDPKTKEFEIEVGTPPTSALIKKEASIEKGSGEPSTKKVGNIGIERAIKIAKMKRDDMLAVSLKSAVREVVGVCDSMGVTVDDKPAREVQKKILEGAYDTMLQ